MSELRKRFNTLFTKCQHQYKVGIDVHMTKLEDECNNPLLDVNSDMAQINAITVMLLGMHAIKYLKHHHCNHCRDILINDNSVLDEQAKIFCHFKEENEEIILWWFKYAQNNI